MHGASAVHGPDLQRGDVVRIRAERWRIVRAIRFDEAAIVEVAGCDRANRGVGARFLLPAERIERLPMLPDVRMVGPARWRRAARQALAEATPRPESLRAAAHARLDILPFQLQPALAVTRGVGARLLIADDVGLGKTIQAGLILAEVLARVHDGHALVVVPAALRDQWQHELSSRFDLESVVLEAATLARAGAAAGIASNPWTMRLVISSIDYVKRPEVIRALEPIVWDVLVLDEAHGLTGPSDRAAAARALARRARTVVLLSATPHSGDADAFARLCATGALAGDGPLLLFRRTRDDAGFRSRRRTWWCRVRTTDAEAAMHRRLLEYVRLVCARRPEPAAARLAMSVLLKRALSSPASLVRSLERRLDLLWQPERTLEAQLVLPFTADAGDAEPGAILAVPGLQDPDEERARLQEILNVASAACRGESKLRALARLIRRTSEPAVVFTEYRDTLHHLGAFFAGVDAAYLHGGLTAGERRDALERFVKGGARLLLATDAASEGLNLHHRCRLVINVELPWNPVRLEQRAGRVDRIGQRRRAHAVHLVGRDTAEEHIVLRLMTRRARAHDALASVSAARMQNDAGRVVEREIERAVIDAVPLPDVSREDGMIQPAASRSGERVRAPDLAAAAAEEAARIVAARHIGRGAGGDSGVRPVGTVLRRRLPGHRRRLIWMYRLPCVDAHGVVRWEATYAAVTTPRHTEFPLRPARLAMELRAAPFTGLLRPEEGAQIELARAWADGIRAPAAQRLEAIADDLRRTRARIAALQGSLFDRRAERAAAAQISVLEAALDRCAIRLASLAALEAIEAGPRELVFAVALA